MGVVVVCIWQRWQMVLVLVWTIRASHQSVRGIKYSNNTPETVITNPQMMFNMKHDPESRWSWWQQNSCKFLFPSFIFSVKNTVLRWEKGELELAPAAPLYRQQFAAKCQVHFLMTLTRSMDMYSEIECEFRNFFIIINFCWFQSLPLWISCFVGFSGGQNSSEILQFKQRKLNFVTIPFKSKY